MKLLKELITELSESMGEYFTKDYILQKLHEVVAHEDDEAVHKEMIRRKYYPESQSSALPNQKGDVEWTDESVIKFCEYLSNILGRTIVYENEIYNFKRYALKANDVKEDEK